MKSATHAVRETDRGIVSVWAEADGRVFVWRRIPESGVLVRESIRFRPWVLLDRLDDLRHLGARLVRDEKPVVGTGRVTAPGLFTYRELRGPGTLRYLVRADDMRTIRSAILRGASRRFAQPVTSLRDLGKASVLALPLDEQYLVASGRTSRCA